MKIPPYIALKLEKMKEQHLKAIKELENRFTYDMSISFEYLAEILTKLNEIKNILKDEKL